MSTDIIEGDFRPLAVQEHRPPAAPQLLDALRPAERVALMAEISGVVADVINKQGWFVKIHDKKHITIHGWTFVGSLAGCSVKTTGYEKIEGGYKAHASVVRVDSGIEVGSAEQVYMKTESFGRGKDDYALIGMASTRACSRALSTTFRHVVELAGYSATPAEEMHKEDKPLGPPEPPVKPLPELIAELKDQARSFGILNFTLWAAEKIDPVIAETKRLTRPQADRAKLLLDAMIEVAPAPKPAPQPRPAGPPAQPPRPPKAPPAGPEPPQDVERRIQPRTNGRLFAMLSERGMDEKHDRVVWAAEQGVVVTSFSELTESQGRDLIRKLELIPPHDARDEEDALWAELEQQKRMGLL